MLPRLSVDVMSTHRVRSGHDELNRLGRLGHKLVVERRGNSPCHSAGSRELRLRDLLQRLAARFDADPEQCE
jgi:hypothetical protein